jgi:hypothetical protein
VGGCSSTLGWSRISSQLTSRVEPCLWEDEERQSAPLEFVAESFEGFLWRFWVENELWFAVYYDKTTILEAGRAYVADYRARGGERA